MVDTTSPTQVEKTGKPLKEGEVVEKVDYCAVDSEVEATTGGAATAEESAAEQPEVPGIKKLYFVRVPRPPMDDSHGVLKKLQDDFQGHVAKIKKINAKLSIRREETRELRKHMSQARSLKGESQPEFEEKLTRLRQLKDLRSGYQGKITNIKTALKGLECKSEEELDAKIKELEHRISHDQILLRDEKAYVKQIGLLGSQRERVKQYDSEKGSLVEMESECSKIKAVINEMDSEFSILKSERDSAQKIISDIYAKLLVAEKGMKEVEEEQTEAVRLKNESLEALDAARDLLNADMKDYRENRKFSMQVRDMVAAGQVDEAAALCEAQVETWTTRLGTDIKFRTAYQKLWAGQRKVAVSELLPESSTEGSAAAAKGGRAGGADGDKPRAVANGAEKAKLLIASLMQQASQEATVVRAERAQARAIADPRARNEEEDNYADDENAEPVVLTPGEILTAAMEAAAKVSKSSSREPVALVKNPAAKAAEVFGAKVELPKVVAGPEFVLPESSVAAEGESALSKEQVREEQRLKAKEAEERKKKRVEAAEEKRVKAAERQKVLEAEAKAAAAAAKTATAKAATAAAKAAAAAKEEAEATSAAEAEASATSGRSLQSGPLNPLIKTTVVASAKRPASKGVDKKLKKVWQQHQTSIVIAALVFLLVLILLMVSFM